MKGFAYQEKTLTSKKWVDLSCAESDCDITIFYNGTFGNQIQESKGDFCHNVSIVDKSQNPRSIDRNVSIEDGIKCEASKF